MSNKAPTKIAIKVSASSSKDAIFGWMGDVLKMRVRAPAERGKANLAVVQLLAATLKLPKSALSISSGHTSSQKIISIHGLSKNEILEKLSSIDT